ncbi:uncharacterized protein J4E87_005720 [Alternaria ethzedia]|uniref:uncharacterized protein n=1 Tax=Alternaria ethzedia TaxID=181014 RepID=UPI0020C4FA2A|nr:uncharacterized protein J4E87_005720 [Alternaria ethzedia]KAI4624221.1 hypothetical protein J4E87_005720 [Alternaria ethzedia]
MNIPNLPAVRKDAQPAAGAVSSARCEKAGFKCDGPQSIVFVQGKIVKSRRSQKLKSKAADPPVTTVWKRQEVEESTSESPEHRFDLPEIRPKFNDKEVCICYARRHLLPNGPIDLGLQELQPSDIVTDNYAARGASSPLFVQAALSFATLFFGAQHHQSGILAEGYAIHGVALKRLNQALSQPERRMHDDVIVSVILLAMLELFMPTGPRNWLKHMLGMEQLLALRDPSSLVHASFRTLELYKAASDELFKLQHASGLSYIQRRQEMQCKADGTLVFLRAWKRRWDSNEENVHIEEECLDPTSTQISPRIIYRFMSDSVARMLMLYNTAFIYTLRVMATLGSKTNGTQDIPSDHIQGGTGADVVTESSYYPAIHAAGLNIACCITDYLQHKRARGETDFVSPMVQWAVITAGQALGGEESPDGKWMVSLLKGDAMYTIAKRAWEV